VTGFASDRTGKLGCKTFKEGVGGYHLEYPLGRELDEHYTELATKSVHLFRKASDEGPLPLD
jgi:hypothetical protein